MRLCIVVLALTLPALWCGPGSAEDRNMQDTQSHESLDTRIKNAAHEPAYVILRSSAELFRNGRRDEGVFWYYVGQLRARIEGMSDQRRGEAYSAVFETIGPQINAYAFGDIDKLAATMDRVLAWDNEHPLENADPAHRAQVRDGLVKLRTYLVEHKDEIRNTRAAQGMANSAH
jgi:hypothetical protein